jgi:hypothetical protein
MPASPTARAIPLAAAALLGCAHTPEALPAGARGRLELDALRHPSAAPAPAGTRAWQVHALPGGGQVAAWLACPGARCQGQIGHLDAGGAVGWSRPFTEEHAPTDVEGIAVLDLDTDGEDEVLVVYRVGDARRASVHDLTDLRLVWSAGLRAGEGPAGVDCALHHLDLNNDGHDDLALDCPGRPLRSWTWRGARDTWL